MPLPIGLLGGVGESRQAGPSSLVATGGALSITLVGSVVAGATTYLAFESGTLVGYSATPTIVVAGLTAGSTHTYTMRALTAVGETADSPAAAATVLGAATAPTSSSVVTVDRIKSHLVGLGPWLQGAAVSSAAYDDAKIARLIPAMIRRFQRETKFRIDPVQCIGQNDGLYAVADGNGGFTYQGIPVDVEDGYDYISDNVEEFFKITLNQRPVQQVQRVRVLIGDQTVFTFPSNWLNVKKKQGVLHVLPTSGQLLIAGISTAQFAALSVAFGNKGYIPNGIQVDYVAGLPTGWQNRDEWADMVRVLEEYCAWAVLCDIAELADAGLMNIQTGGDGSSEGYSYTRFQSRKQELADSVESFKATLREQESEGIMLAFV